MAILSDDIEKMLETPGYERVRTELALFVGEAHGAMTSCAPEELAELQGRYRALQQALRTPEDLIAKLREAEEKEAKQGHDGTNT